MPQPFKDHIQGASDDDYIQSQLCGRPFTFALGGTLGGATVALFYEVGPHWVPFRHPDTDAPLVLNDLRGFQLVSAGRRIMARVAGSSGASDFYMALNYTDL